MSAGHLPIAGRRQDGTRTASIWIGRRLYDFFYLIQRLRHWHSQVPGQALLDVKWSLVYQAVPIQAPGDPCFVGRWSAGLHLLDIFLINYNWNHLHFQNLRGDRPIRRTIPVSALKCLFVMLVSKSHPAGFVIKETLFNKLTIDGHVFIIHLSSSPSWSSKFPYVELSFVSGACLNKWDESLFNCGELLFGESSSDEWSGIYL